MAILVCFAKLATIITFHSSADLISIAAVRALCSNVQKRLDPAIRYDFSNNPTLIDRAAKHSCRSFRLEEGLFLHFGFVVDKEHHDTRKHGEPN